MDSLYVRPARSDVILDHLLIHGGNSSPGAQMESKPMLVAKVPRCAVETSQGIKELFVISATFSDAILEMFYQEVPSVKPLM